MTIVIVQASRQIYAATALSLALEWSSFKTAVLKASVFVTECHIHLSLIYIIFQILAFLPLRHLSFNLIKMPVYSQG